MPTRFEVYGSNGDTDTYLAESLAQKISKDCGTADDEITVIFEAFLEVDFVRKLKDLERQYGGSMLLHKATHVIIRDGVYLGTFGALKALAVSEYKIEDMEHFGNTIVVNRRSREEFQACVLAVGRPCVYIDFVDGSKSKRNPDQEGTPTPVYGRLIVELFTDRAPLACENFIKLCTGEAGATEEAKLHYVGCPVHRVVPGGWIQCGDIVAGTGKSSLSAIGDNGRLADETLTCDFSEPLGGIVGYSTSEPHSIGSQFFITLGKCDWMNGCFEGFGRVIQGYSTLKAIETAPLLNQRPAQSIVVAEAGKVVFK